MCTWSSSGCRGDFPLVLLSYVTMVPFSETQLLSLRLLISLVFLSVNAFDYADVTSAEYLMYLLIICANEYFSPMVYFLRPNVLNNWTIVPPGSDPVRLNYRTRIRSNMDGVRNTACNLGFGSPATEHWYLWLSDTCTEFRISICLIRIQCKNLKWIQI